jgi:hypothetical protein
MYGYISRLEGERVDDIRHRPIFVRQVSPDAEFSRKIRDREEVFSVRN